MPITFANNVFQTFQIPKMEESSPSYKLYGYGLWFREFPSIPKIAKNKVQETLHFRYRSKCWVTDSENFLEKNAPQLCGPKGKPVSQGLIKGQWWFLVTALIKPAISRNSHWHWRGLSTKVSGWVSDGFTIVIVSWLVYFTTIYRTYIQPTYIGVK